MITPTPEQLEVIDFAVKRIKNRERITTIGGFAGTGKTSITGFIVDALRPHSIAFVCYTGKAKSVLENKLKTTNSLRAGDFIGTIHSLVYSPIAKEKKTEKNGREYIKVGVEFTTKNNLEGKYFAIIVDEASMVDQYIFEDLLELGLPILAIGDHGQLPPVASKFNLLQILTIHRKSFW